MQRSGVRLRAAIALAGVFLAVIPMLAEPSWAYGLGVAGAVAALAAAVSLGTAPSRWAALARNALSAQRNGPAQRAVPGRHPAALARNALSAQRNGPAQRAVPGRHPAGLGRWTGPGTLVAAVAIVECAVSRLGATPLTGEGLLLLGYLLLLDGPAGDARTGRPAGAARRWLRSRTPAVLAGVAASGLVLAALAAAPSASPWIVLGGLAAAVAAYLIAAPRHRRRAVSATGPGKAGTSPGTEPPAAAG
jgi:hypothetical protein